MASDVGSDVIVRVRSLAGSKDGTEFPCLPRSATTTRPCCWHRAASPSSEGGTEAETGQAAPLGRGWCAGGMSGKGGVPDAWADDWEALADKPAGPEKAQPAHKLTKAQKKAQHIEQQKQLWDSADNPDRFHWLETQGVVPLKQEYRQPVTLLSRKPVTAKKDAADGLAKLSLEDDDDSEEERRRKRESEFEERQRKAKLDRAEKERRYAEARERIMGSCNQSPASNSRENSQARDSRRGRGGKAPTRRSQPQSSAEQSPARQPGGDTKLFDPDDIRRLAPRCEMNSTPTENQPLRQPRGPDKSGALGFAGRGGKLPSCASES